MEPIHPVDNVDLVVGLVVHANGGVARRVVENKFEVVCLRGAGAEIDARLGLPVCDGSEDPSVVGREAGRCVDSPRDLAAGPQRGARPLAQLLEGVLLRLDAALGDLDVAFDDVVLVAVGQEGGGEDDDDERSHGWHVVMFWLFFFP